LPFNKKHSKVIINLPEICYLILEKDYIIHTLIFTVKKYPATVVPGNDPNPLPI